MLHTAQEGSALTETVCGCQGKLLGSSVHGGVATSEHICKGGALTAGGCCPCNPSLPVAFLARSCKATSFSTRETQNVYF